MAHLANLHASGKKADPEVSFLYDIFENELFKRTGERCMPFLVAQSKKSKIYTDAVTAHSVFSEWVDKMWSGNETKLVRSERISIYRVLVTIIANYIEDNFDCPLSMSVMLKQTKNISNLMDRQFPGYGNSKLLSFILISKTKTSHLFQ